MTAAAPLFVREPDATYDAGDRLIDRVRAAMRLRHLSVRTETAYLQWMRRYFEFHGRRHPAGLGAEEVAAFLSDLATARRVSASTQNQALAALLFLYRQVLGLELRALPVGHGGLQSEDLDHVVRVAEHPVVLAHDLGDLPQLLGHRERVGRGQVDRGDCRDAGRATRCP